MNKAVKFKGEDWVTIAEYILEITANRFETTKDKLCIKQYKNREIVWLSAADAENDDGSKAVAEFFITREMSTSKRKITKILPLITEEDF